MNLISMACRFEFYGSAKDERTFVVNEEECKRIVRIERTAGTVSSITVVLRPGWRRLKTDLRNVQPLCSAFTEPESKLALKDALMLPRSEMPGTIAANTRLCFCLNCVRVLEDSESEFAARWRLMRAVMYANEINWLAPSAEAQAVKLLNAISNVNEVTHGNEAKFEG